MMMRFFTGLLIVCVYCCSAQVSIWQNVGNYALLYPGIYYNQEVPITGQTGWWQWEFAEKYTNTSPIYIRGIATQNWGQLYSRDTFSLHVYDVGANGLPNNQLYEHRFSSACMKLDGNVNYYLFNQPIVMPDTFFVSISFGEYWLQGQHDEVYVLNCGSCRTNADLSLYGRNALRTADGVWRDIFAARGLKTHLAIFPIVSTTQSDVVAYTDNSFCVLSSITTEEETQLTLYPNPTTDILCINTPTPALISAVVVYDLCGRLLISETPLSGNSVVAVSLHTLPRGTYFVSVQVGDAKHMQKIQKL